MRLLFIVPSNIHKTTAGSRIRYDRLALGGANSTFRFSPSAKLRVMICHPATCASCPKPIRSNRLRLLRP